MGQLLAAFLAIAVAVAAFSVSVDFRTMTIRPVNSHDIIFLIVFMGLTLVVFFCLSMRRPKKNANMGRSP